MIRSSPIYITTAVAALGLALSAAAQQEVRSPAPADKAQKARDFFGLGAPPDPAAVKRGQAIYVANCGFCHGTTAQGGAQGPDLVRSVLVLHDHGTGNEIGPVILTGRIDRGMPRFGFTEAQIKDVAAYLQSRSDAAADRTEYKILNINTGNPKAGERYFSEHCASCHSASGDLAHIATRYAEPVALQARFLMPRSRPPKPDEMKTVTVTLPSGQTVSGKLKYEDDFSVTISEPSGEYHTFLFDTGAKAEVHDPLEAHEKLLPQYTDADMHNVLAYLETLK